ncbi:MAG: ribosome silencing factor [Actinomycetota bacterium]|nr:ribosome silencing factor [Actinomycetota bacterium]
MTLPRQTAPTPRTAAVRAARAASEKQATDIRVLDVSDLIAITDFFVIASGRTDRQVRAIADAIEEDLRKSGLKPVRREGEREMRWLLLDYADIVVHIFTEEDRAYYELERLWKDAPDVKWEIQRRQTTVRAAKAR